MRVLLLAGAAAVGFSFVSPKQRQASHRMSTAAKSSKDLPEVSQLMAKPQHVLDSFGMTLSALRSQISEQQKRGQEDLAAQTARYKTVLTSQESEIKELNLTNYGIRDDIKQMQTRNKMQRDQAIELQQENAKLVADLRDMRKDIKTAREFIDRELSAFRDLLNTSEPELQVLTELDTWDKEAARLRRYDQIAGIAAVKPTLLQVQSRDSTSRRPWESVLAESGTESGTELSSQLLATLSRSLSDFAAEQNASDAALKESFDSEFESGTKLKNSLLKEQEQLNSTMTFEAMLNGKLGEAVRVLTSARDRLSERRRAALQFVERLASKGLNRVPAKSVLVAHGQLDGQVPQPLKKRVSFSQMNDSMGSSIGNQQNQSKGAVAEK